MDCRAPKRIGLIPRLAGGSIAFLLLAAGVAFACVPQARLVYVEPGSFGASGSSVTVRAAGLDPGPAEVRWKGPEGPLLATGTGPNLSAAVTIPAEPPGLYQILVLSRNDNGVLGNTAASGFLVTGAALGQAPTGAAKPPPRKESPDGSSTRVIAAGAVGLLALGLALGSALGRRWARTTAPETPV